MSEIMKLLENPTSTVTTILFVLVAVKFTIDLINWYKTKFRERHQDINAEEKFHDEVTHIACVSQEHTEALVKIGEALEGINRRLDDAEEQRRQNMIANGRATLFNLYNEFKGKPELSLSEYETFNEVAAQYLEAGGNSIFRDKIIPEILRKPIKDE